MSYDFNPLTFELDRVVRTSSTFGKLELIADTIDVISKTFDLGVTPLEDSEYFFLNGMMQSSDCYTIVGTELILDNAFPLELGDNIIIKYTT